MLKRPVKKELSVEEQQSVLSASRGQTGKASVIKSYDPEYPVFEVPVNQKVLVYIPNHVIQSEDGSVDIRADKFAAHPYQMGREYGNIRCTSGVVINSLGLDGTCPACDAISESWELCNLEFEEFAKSRGFADVAEAKTTLKEDWKKFMEKRAIKQAEVWYTFPIVLIDCEVGADGKPTTKPKLDANGNITGKPVWYSIREKTYVDKWISSLDAVEDAEGNNPTHPAGLWATLNFTYQSDSGTYDKMQSAKNLKVTYKSNPDATLTRFAAQFDKMTEAWTPEKAGEVVVLDAWRDMTETREAVDAIMKGTRDQIALLKTAKGISAPIGTTSAQDALASFSATELPGATAQAPAGVITSEMPGNVGV